MTRFCPNCQSERKLSEIFCEGIFNNSRCNWDLTGEPIFRQPAPTIEENISLAHGDGTVLCPNGHQVEAGDIICMACGAEVDEQPPTAPVEIPLEPSAPVGSAPLAVEAIVDGWRLLKHLPTNDDVRELYVAERAQDRHQAIVTIYKQGSEPDPAIYDVLRSLPRDHVPEILATGRWDGRVYEAVEELTGGTLAEIGLVADDLDTLRHIIGEIGRALHAFSEVGLRHRDLRPDTILVRERAPLDLVIIGFGSARLSDYDLDIVSPLETSRYMAPEAVAGGVAAASDWWSLGMLILEQVTRGKCFEGINKHAFLIHILANGVPLPENLSPTVALLLRGLLAKDRNKRWQWPEVSAWLKGEPVAAPEAQSAEKDSHTGPSIPLAGRHYHKPASFALAAAEKVNWEEAKDQLLRGVIATWAEELHIGSKIMAGLRQVVKQENLNDDFRLSVALTLLNPAMPLIFQGQIVTPGWLLEFPVEGYELISGPAPDLLNLMETGNWLSRLKSRIQQVRIRAKNLGIDLDEESLRIYLLSTSKARLIANWNDRRRLFPDTDHNGLLSLSERQQISEDDLIVLLSASIGQFRSVGTIIGQAEDLARNLDVSAFDQGNATTLLNLSRQEIYRLINDRIEGFARCSIPRIDEWADQFRLERRMILARALVLLAVPAEQWIAPQKQQYVSQILDFFEKKVSGAVLRGPLVRMTIGKTTARVDLMELGGERRDAKGLLNQILQRTEHITAIDPTAFSASTTLERRLTSLHRSASLYKRDTGIDGLYMGFPFLLMRDARGNAKPRIAPLLLWPIKLVTEIGNRGNASIAFDGEREEVRLNPAFEGLIGLDATKRWSEIANELLGRTAIKAADVIDAFGMLANARERTLTTLPPPVVEVTLHSFELSCSAVLFHVTFIGQAIVEDLRQLKSIPPTGTGLETALRTTTQKQEDITPPRISEVDRYFTVASDPSQEAAVLQARNGPGLLVEGPPGTGKSQTIVNMVADAIGRNRSLLVICQKQAALEVVRKRLLAEGLGDRMVMITDVNRDREQVIRRVREQIESLRGRTESGISTLRRNRERLAAKIEALEGELDRHHHALHQVDTLTGLTYRRLIGELIGYEEGAPPIDVPALRQFLLQFDTAQLATMEENCAPLARYWLPSNYEDSALAVLQQFAHDRATIDSFTRDFQSFRDIDADRSRTLNETPSEFDIDDPEPDQAWLNKHCETFLLISDTSRKNLANWMQHFGVGTGGKETGHHLGYKAIVSLRKTEEDLADLDINAHHASISTWLVGISTEELTYWIATAASALKNFSWLDRINPIRYLKERQILSFLKEKAEAQSLHTVSSFLKAARLELKFRPIRKNAGSIYKSIAAAKSEFETNSLEDFKKKIADFKKELEEVARLVRAIESSPHADRIIAAVTHATRTAFDLLVSGFDAAFIRCEVRKLSIAALQRLESWFTIHWIDECRSAILNNGSTLQNTIGIFSALPTLQSYQQFRIRAAQLNENEITVFAKLRERKNLIEKLPAGSLEAEIRRIINREARLAWKQYMEQEQPTLLLERSEIESKISSLADADIEIRKLNRELLVGNLDLSTLGARQEWEDITRLRGQRSRRLREFIDRGADIGLMALRPVWLMNPDVASRVLPLKSGMFDTVIYDEASQMPVEYALPTLFRAKTIVVSGDEKQMPPSSFFSGKVENDEAEVFDSDDLAGDASEEERDVYEETWNRREIKDCPDLLLLSRGVLPITTLQIHYRSVYRELISFSNASFYGDRLSVPVRHPEDLIRNKKPVMLFKIDGVYQNQTNPDEAQKVVQILANIWKRPFAERPSVGVVTFNRKQADLIEEVLELRAESDDDFRKAYSEELERTEKGEDMSIFVKNVENVQGDERDVIVFSSTFGRNSQGTFRRNFGVLGQQGGERRLNVAVTRARQKIIMVTSMPIDEISDMLSTHRAPMHPRDYLQGYLEYARALSSGEFSHGKTILTRLVTDRSTDHASNKYERDGFSKAVAEYIGTLGHKVSESKESDAFGLDYAIENPDTGLYAIGIECDAPRHRLLEHARAREIWRPSVLKRSIPYVHRVSSHGWYHDGHHERGLLRHAIKSALAYQENA